MLKKEFLLDYLEFYRSKIIPDLIKKFNYKNVMQAPKLEKICINVGVGAAVADPKLIDVTVNEIMSNNWSKTYSCKS